MKKQFLSIILILALFACNNQNDLLHKSEDEIEYIELTPEQVVLKQELADAAIIIAQICKDKSVLNEVVNTIKSQPQDMEDRVKFATLMQRNNDEKSVTLGLFKSKFEEALNQNDLKSANTIVDDLSSEGIELKIPYPIEDYPVGTDIAVTSDPLDNDVQNTGFYINSGEEVLVNQELTKTRPVLIIAEPEPEISRPGLDEGDDVPTSGDSSDDSNDEGTTGGGSTTDPEATTTRSFDDWNKENLGHMIRIEKIYCKEDHKKNLFKKNTIINFVVGDINFDQSTNQVNMADGQNPKMFSVRIEPKYERYADNGWAKGWKNIENPILHNWHPAISERNLAAWAEVDGANNDVTEVLTATAKITAEILNMKGLSTVFNSEEKTYGDVLYGSNTVSRSSYKYLYNTRGTLWGENGETNYPIEGHGRRPALQIGPDLLYITTWETYPID